MKIALLAAFILELFLFLVLSEKRVVERYWRSVIDKHIPYVPLFVLPYVAFFPFIFLTIYLLYETTFALDLLGALVVANLFALLFWFFVPTRVERIDPGKGMLNTITAVIHKYDKGSNAFPSSHVFTTVICSFYLLLAFPAYSLTIYTIGILIAVSTIFVKQHYLVDIPGGMLWAYGAISLVGLL